MLTYPDRSYEASETPPRLSYFPEIFPDELLTSVMARFVRHMGLNRFAASLLIFGNSQEFLQIPLTSRILQIERALPVGSTHSHIQLMLDHTLYKYFTAFSPDDERSRIAKAMLEGGAKEKTNSRFRSSSYPRNSIRFCPKYVTEMTKNYGEAYWRRDHQIPLVLVCPKHHCILHTAYCLGCDSCARP